MSLLDSLFGIHNVYENGDIRVTRKALDFIGDFVVTDDPTTGRTRISIEAPPGFIWQGAWDVGTAYADRDVVTHAAKVWLATSATAAGDEPGVEPEWELMLESSGLVWEGAWDNGTAYAELDIVSHLGSVWIAASNTSAGDEPGVEPEWELILEASAERGPNTETDTGDTYNGAPIYRQRFSGASFTAGSHDLIASGVTAIIGAGGWIVDDAGNRHLMPMHIIDGFPGFRASLHVSSAGALIITIGTQLDNNAYDFWVEYLK